MNAQPSLPVEFSPAPPTQVVVGARPMPVSTVRATFDPWLAPPIRNLLGSKKLLDSFGSPAFAELHLTRLFQRAGWSSRWVETWTAPKARPCFLTHWNEADRDLKSLKGQDDDPPNSGEILLAYQEIASANGGRHAGAWDVLAWSGCRLLFVESKLRGKDHIRGSQVRWLEAALKVGSPFGISLDSFLIVEWTNRVPWPKPPAAQSTPTREDAPAHTEQSLLDQVPFLEQPRTANIGRSLASISTRADRAAKEPVSSSSTPPGDGHAPVLVPNGMPRAEFDQRFSAFWKHLLELHRSGEKLSFAPRSTGAGIGNVRRVIDMTPSEVHLLEDGRGNNSMATRAQIEEDFWALAQEPDFDRASVAELRKRFGIKNFVEFKRDMYEQFRAWCRSRA